MGFANPFALIFAGLYAVLVALYLWERSRHRVDVPSLLLWEIVPEETIQSGQPRFDLLFALQCILLATLIGALAKPFLTFGSPAPPARHVFVLDVSASMKVREGSMTRFEMATRALRQRLRGLPDGDESMLLSAAERPRVVVPFSREREELLRRLNDIEPLDTGTNLELSLAAARSAAARGDRAASIEVFTDTPVSDLDERWRGHARFLQFGESDDNVALQSLQVLQGRFQDEREARGRALIHNFSHRDVHGFLKLDVDGEVFAQQGFSLEPREARTFLMDAFPKPGVLRARLEPPDALAVDNVAYAWVRPALALEVLVVSRHSSLRAELEAIARATPNLRFHFMDPEHYTSGVESNADVVVFRQFVPDVEPRRPALYLYPEADSHLFRVLGNSEGVEVLNWNEHHPVLRNLQPITARPLRHVRLLERPPWAEDLLSSRNAERDIPIAFAGERDGRRIACMAFDPGEERLVSAENIPMLLFFLNLLDWLGPADEEVSLARTGEVQTINGLAPGTRRVTDPRGRSFTLPSAANDDTARLEVLEVGQYVIGTDGTRRRVLGNLFDPRESDVGRASSTASPAPVSTTQPPRPRLHGSGLAGWLLLLSTGLLVTEWLVATRRKCTRGRD